MVADTYVFPSGTATQELYRLNPNGTGRTLLTVPDNCGKGLPKVSPLGNRVAFRWGCPYLDMTNGVYAIPPGGGTPQPVTPASPTHYEAFSGFDWSPDGSRIVYTREPWGPLGNQTFDLFVVDLTTGVATQLTNTGYIDGRRTDEDGPVFSPDGGRIAYHRDGNIWVMNADGSGQTPLTATAQYEDWASWQPCIAGVTTRCVLTPLPPPQPPPGPPPPGPPPPPVPAAAGPAASTGPTAGPLSRAERDRPPAGNGQGADPGTALPRRHGAQGALQARRPSRRSEPEGRVAAEGWLQGQPPSGPALGVFKESHRLEWGVRPGALVCSFQHVDS